MPLGDRGIRVFLGLPFNTPAHWLGGGGKGTRLHNGRCYVRKVLNAALTWR